MARAAIDGVSLALVDAFSRAGGDIGIDAPVLAGGGGTRDSAWLCSLADALGRTVAALDEPDLSAWGAARSAATALGWIDPVASPESWRPATRTVEPSLPAAEAAARLDRFRTLADRLFGRDEP
jgi:sugar (pentulose or hexulose) kinase